jgi:hypothetical protein
VTVNSQQILDTLAARYRDTLARHLGDCDDVVLLDFPNHANVGDSLIWLGEIAALRQLGKTVRHVCSIWDYDRGLRPCCPGARRYCSTASIRPREEAAGPQHRSSLSQSIHFRTTRRGCLQPRQPLRSFARDRLASAAGTDAVGSCRIRECCGGSRDPQVGGGAAPCRQRWWRGRRRWRCRVPGDRLAGGARPERGLGRLGLSGPSAIWTAAGTTNNGCGAAGAGACRASACSRRARRPHRPAARGDLSCCSAGRGCAGQPTERSAASSIPDSQWPTLIRATVPSRSGDVGRLLSAMARACPPCEQRR